MFNAGDFLQNRYEIINCIGSGGMSDVYKARDHKLNRYVAIKVLKAEFRGDREFVSKFRVEAQAAAGLAHPNIVNVFDVGEENGNYFIVMELVEGITLKLYIQNRGRLSVREAVGISLQVAAGLEAAHNNGIIHRDVKPQNIIISTDGTAKVADFGIARAATSDTINSNVMGSVHYSAPEQSRGGFSDARSDIYSLGITMYEMLTGKVPFDGDSTVEVALKHLQEEIVSPKAAIPDLPRAIEQIILKCTQKNPDRRYQNMSLLIRDLKESLINPNGDFVRIGMEDAGAATHRYSKEDLEEINRRRSAAGLFSGSYTDRMNYPPENEDIDDYDGRYNGGYDDLHHDGVYEDEDRYDDEFYEDDFDPSFDDRYEDEDDVSGKRSRLQRRKDRDGRTEKLITVFSVLAALLVGGLILYLIFHTVDIIQNGRPGRPGENETNTIVLDLTGDLVSVPNIRGMTEEEAQRSLKELSLGYRYLGETNSAQYSMGQVVSQDVEPDTRVKKNTTVGYILSKGQELTVPDLTGKSEGAATEALASLGLHVSVDNTRFSNEYDAGSVITTNPGSGSTVHEGDTVTLYISQGEDTQSVIVPNVEGKYRDDALTMLNNYNLFVYVASEPSNTVQEGLVIRQDIKEGTSVQTGSTITITVSTGPENPIVINPSLNTSTSISVEEGLAGGPQAVPQEETWVCNAQLSEPSGYAGETVRITLAQNDTIRTVFEGRTTFPYVLRVEGEPGVSEGMAYVYVLDDNGNVKTTTSYKGIVFQKQ